MYLVTASLLNAWKYLLEGRERYDKDGKDMAMKDFLRVLRRLPSEKTKAMEKGDAFELWAKDNLPELQGAVYQPSYSVASGDVLLYGRLDFIKAGIVYDTKYATHYEAGKFYGSPQTSMYLALVPEARKMVYLVSSSEEGETIWREEYPREEVRPIMEIVSEFHDWLETAGLQDLYYKYWKAKGMT